MDVRQNQCDLSQSLHSEAAHRPRSAAVNRPAFDHRPLATDGSGAQQSRLWQAARDPAAATSLLIGVITDVSIETPAIARERGYDATAKIDLMGEIKQDQDGATHFERGVANYPVIGDAAALLTAVASRLIQNEISNAKKTRSRSVSCSTTI